MVLFAMLVSLSTSNWAGGEVILLLSVTAILVHQGAQKEKRARR